MSWTQIGVCQVQVEYKPTHSGLKFYNICSLCQIHWVQVNPTKTMWRKFTLWERKCHLSSVLHNRKGMSLLAMHEGRKNVVGTKILLKKRKEKKSWEAVPTTYSPDIIFWLSVGTWKLHLTAMLYCEFKIVIKKYIVGNFMQLY